MRDEHYTDDLGYDHNGLEQLPDMWQSYTCLSVLKLPHFRGDDLPDWFPDLQQLVEIHMPESCFSFSALLCPAATTAAP